MTQQEREARELFEQRTQAANLAVLGAALTRKE